LENKKLKIAIGVTGASGSIYAQTLLKQLQTLSNQIAEMGLVMSKNAEDVWEYELGNRDFEKLPIKRYEKNNFFAPFASGSANYDALIICPCSMGTLGRIAAGVSDDLMTRAADVMLKERKNLILVLRDTPYNLIHINNMKTIAEAGGILCPASPSFYSKPSNFEELAQTVTNRVIQLAGLEMDGYRWGSK
jgi:4-hydroxy-3-polyprenylbenzoate decarboxylase